MSSIIKIEGIGDVYGAKLKAAGVSTVKSLLDKGATRDGRAQLEKATGITGALILRWVNHADLCRIKGIAWQFSELLEAAGVDSVPELSKRKPDNLHAKVSEVNAAKHLCGRTPTSKEVASWIEQAKTLPRVVKH